MLKRSHLSEKTCREMIQLFADDLTATQIARYTGVSRVTVNNYLRLIRTHIVMHCAALNPLELETGCIPAPVTEMEKSGPEDPNAYYYGCCQHADKVFTKGLFSMDKHTLLGLRQIRFTKPEEQVLPGSLEKFHAVVDFESWKLYQPGCYVQGNADNSFEEIAIFWGNTRNRLIKFRGLNKRTLGLHLKESEFRHNYRNQDINALLLNIIYKYPLQHGQPMINHSMRFQVAG
jgi:transposase